MSAHKRIKWGPAASLLVGETVNNARNPSRNLADFYDGRRMFRRFVGFLSRAGWVAVRTHHVCWSDSVTSTVTMQRDGREIRVSLSAREGVDFGWSSWAEALAPSRQRAETVL